ncbi:MAG: hypothetical protein LC785_13800 [Acidobacteria bacterium]|nr:hypothetical protein [Acidobacteriota bacterium]MCA1642988.1 hypothetical protein [Acidobacteriota bacterium]
MKRILLIATLIFLSCAVAPARESGEGVSGSPMLSVTGDNPGLEKDTTLRFVVSESAGVDDDRR